MTAAVAVDSRRELSRLILDGLKGRSLMQLYAQLKARFAERKEALSLACFYRWVNGEAFPASRHRQIVLAEVIGGPCGEAIKHLPGPAFRGWRRRVMKESETMTSGKSLRAGT